MVSSRPVEKCTHICITLDRTLFLPPTGLHTEHEPGSTPVDLNFPSPARLHLLENIILLLSQERASSDCGLGGFQECFLLSTDK